jgi:hypothetical protein
MTVWSFFGIYSSTYLPWIAWQGLIALVALGFALGLAAPVASALPQGTCCTSGLPWALPSGLALLMASGFALGTRFACDLGFTSETPQNHPHFSKIV